MWFDVTFGGQNSQEFESAGESPQDSPPASDYESMALNLRRRRGNETLVLSTAPEENPTHWQQVTQEMWSHASFVQKIIAVLSSDINNPFLCILYQP